MKKWVSTVAIILGWSGAALWAGPPTLTTLSAVHELSNDQAAQHLRVDFEATVTYFRGYERTLFVQDGDIAIYVQATTQLQLAPGDRVRVEGITHESFHPFVQSSSITRLSHDLLPQPVRASFDDLIQARYDCRLVTVRGVVRTADVLNFSARNAAMQLISDGGYIDLTVDTNDAAALRGMLDSEVEVTGAASGHFDGKMQQTGVLVHLASIDNIKVLKHADLNPWTLPESSMDQILSHYHVHTLTPRIRVQGTITYYQPGSAAVLQSGPKSLWISTQGRDDLKIDDIADATGIPDVSEGFLTLTKGEIQDTGVRAPVAPRLSNWSDLTQSHHLHDLVSVQGEVLMEVREAAQDEYVLLSEGHLFSAIIRHPTATFSSISPVILPAMKMIPVGAKVQVEGICILEDSNPFDAQVPFNLLMRSMDDITIIARPSLLTVRNLVRLVSLLLLGLLAIGVWGWTLRRKVHRQTAALAYQSAIEAARERRNTELERRRSRILEDINGVRPLAEILEDLTRLVSFQLNGPPCWCEIASGARLGEYPDKANRLTVTSEEIPARSGPALGTLYAAFLAPIHPKGAEHDIMVLGAQLAKLAIETRRLYSDLVHRSEFDLLTDIHNRFSLEKQLDATIAIARDQARIFGVIFVDLDEFKQVNDLYGHQVGDLYLQEVSLRMKRQLRTGDLLARLGGDEFAALVPTARSRADVEEIALRLERCFDEPFSVEGYLLRGSGSVGIALYPEDGSTKDNLLSAADAAMYVAKFTKRQSLDEAASPGKCEA